VTSEKSRPLLALSAAALLAACASPNPQPIGAPPPGELYRCEQALEFRVRFVDDTAVIEGQRGFEVLLRDAGGLTPQQTVFSNTRLRAEFGLGEKASEALLRYPQESLALRCVRVAGG
jgi:hypothetical protein